MKTCQRCGGAGRVRSDASGLAMWCTACGGCGEIGGDGPQPWIETHGPFGCTTIYSTPSQWMVLQPSDAPHIAEIIVDLERRVARLETMQRRKPKRKAGRR